MSSGRVASVGVLVVALVAVASLVGAPADRVEPAFGPHARGHGGDVSRGAALLPDGQVVSGQDGDRPDLAGRARLLLRPADGRVPTGRPARADTAPGENLHTPVPHRVGSDFATTEVMDAAMVVGDVALPWRYAISTGVPAVQRQAIRSGVAEWDAHPGSRWSATPIGLRPVGAAVADGTSLIFRETTCEGTTNANTYVFTDGGIGLYRYGANGTMVIEADIGLCPQLSDPLEIRRTVRHEVGHVVGLAHLCDPEDECHTPAMGDDNACSIMFWQARGCQVAIDEGSLRGQRTLYSTIRQLHGPTPEQTTARASFATTRDGEAPVIVVSAAAAATPATAAAAAEAAARAGGVWLLGRPDQAQCLSGATRAEVNRAMARRGALVLIGEWPDACSRLAFDWDLQLHQMASPDAGTSIPSDDLAPPRPRGASVVVLDSTAGPASAAAAAALAGSRDAPIVLADEGIVTLGTGNRRPDARSPGEVLLVGVDGTFDEESVRAATEALGASVTVFGGADDVEVALGIASQMWPSSGRAASVVFVPAGSASAVGPDGGTALSASAADVASSAAAALALDRGAAILGIGPAVDERVIAWMAQRRIAQSWAVGAPDRLDEQLLDAYAVHVG